MYGERRCPKFEVEKMWPRNVHSLYAHLRTGHAKELQDYRYKIDQEDNPFCDYTGCGQEVAQTIEAIQPGVHDHSPRDVREDSKPANRWAEIHTQKC